MMHSLTIEPSRPLQSFVRNILILENNTSTSIVAPISFYADGQPGLLFHQTKGGMFINGPTKRLPSVFLYGQTVKPVQFMPGSAYRMIIFFFYPHVIKSLFGIRSSELTDSCIDLSLLPGADIISTIDQLHAENDTEQQIRIINKYLIRLLQLNNASVDNMIRYMVSHIVSNRANTSLKELRNYINVSERTFERKFEHHVGVTPKLFLRICQFQSTLHQLNSKNFTKLSDIAYENGYADQSHFIRTFKEFTGLSPLKYYRQIIQS